MHESLDIASREFEGALRRGDEISARAVLGHQLGDDGVHSAVELIVMPALERIGADWEAGDLPLADVYASGNLAEMLLAEWLPVRPPAGTGQAPVAVAVLEDHHVLGKRLVLSVLRTAGLHVADYGHGLTVDQLVERCRDQAPRVLLVSTLMLPAALRVRPLVEGLAGLEPRPAVIVGGAPFRLDPELWREVGADAGGHTASDAFALVERFDGGAA